MTVQDRYAAIASRCSPIDLDEIWAALLFGRRAILRDDLREIAAELDNLRDDVGRASAARITDNVPKPAPYDANVEDAA